MKNAARCVEAAMLAGLRLINGLYDILEQVEVLESFAMQLLLRRAAEFRF
jgi:hypothetical protein